MTQHLRAVYEDGVFRPLEPVQLEEHQQVTLGLETTDESASGTSEDKPIWEVAAKLVRDIPVDDLSSVATDGATQHDHYLYGAPKRD